MMAIEKKIDKYLTEAPMTISMSILPTTVNLDEGGWGRPINYKKVECCATCEYHAIYRGQSWYCENDKVFYEILQGATKDKGLASTRNLPLKEDHYLMIDPQGLCKHYKEHRLLKSVG